MEQYQCFPDEGCGMPWLEREVQQAILTIKIKKNKKRKKKMVTSDSHQ